MLPYKNASKSKQIKKRNRRLNTPLIYVSGLTRHTSTFIYYNCWFPLIRIIGGSVKANIKILLFLKRGIN